MESTITFIIKYENKENILTLQGYNTVAQLKSKINEIFDITSENLLIRGWVIEPESDNIILAVCTDPSIINRLDVFYEESSDFEAPNTIDVQSAASFCKKLRKEGLPDEVQFHTVSLIDAIEQSCLTNLSERKVLLLYLHNGNKKLSTIFLRNLRLPKVRKTLERNFYLLGWDVEETNFHAGLEETLKQSNLLQVCALVRCQFCAILLIQNINGCINLSSCVSDENISDADFYKSLEDVAKFLEQEKRQEDLLKNLEKTSANENDMDSTRYQQLMADMLGDRDYDSFEFDQHEALKQKIAFSLFGPPETEQGYDEKKNIKVNEIYEIVKRNSNQFVEYLDRVEISFIYNCTEPLPKVKLQRSRQYPDYNPRTDIMPVPIIVLRKCHNSSNPCRLFIDDVGRVYKSWTDYIEKNKLHACKMVLPHNGRYRMSDTYGVILENHLSPACGMTARIFQKADILSTGAGLASGAVFLAASFTSIAIAPAVLLTAGGLGVTAGVYALGRSIYTLIDRKRHQESMSFSNSEARGAYLNILAGALGFAGSGATMAVSQLATNGIEIGQGAGAVVNFFGVANIGASGASIVNSGYDVFDQWYNENRKPSLLTIVQLSSSILFFGNALYNFKTCSTIVEETQAKTLQDYQASLRSNRHRKIFNKMMKETIRRNNGNKVQGKAEVISAVRNFPNKDEVFAALTRSNKAMNQKGVKFYASGGDLTMNGQKINTNDFTSMSKKDVGIFLSKLPSKSVISHSDVLMMQRQFSINKLAIPTTDQFSQFAVKMMGAYDGNIQKMIIIAMTKLYTSLSESIRTTLEEVFPDQPYCYNILSLVMEFFLVKASNLGKQYEIRCETGESKFYQPCFADLDGSEAKRYKLLFEKAVKMCYEGIMFTKVAQEELFNYFNSWLTEQVYEFRVETESAQRRRQHNAREPKRIKVNCEKCGGYYYQCVIIPRGK